jgi:FKBP-type peptidyl-prolyl cis-trans isomerase SlyD
MSDQESISDGKVVEIHYTLTDDNGETLDSSEGHEPLAYLHGASNIVPGLERQLSGHSVGDQFDAAVPPAEAYGEIMGEGPQAVPRAGFPADIELAPGMSFQGEGDDGDSCVVWIVAVEGEQVLIDLNHPLAGMDLNFKVEVVTVRAATQEEIDHGHPHM